MASSTLAAAAAVAAAVAAVALPANAGAAAPGGGWQQAHYGPVTEAPGDVCSFMLHSEPVRQDVWFTTTATYPDGSPKTQLFVGPLYVRFTSVESGAAVVENLSGSALIDYDVDGTQTWYVIGPFSVGFHAGDQYHPPGEFVLDGFTKLILHPARQYQLAAHYGPSTDVCAALQGP